MRPITSDIGSEVFGKLSVAPWGSSVILTRKTPMTQKIKSWQSLTRNPSSPTFPRAAQSEQLRRHQRRGRESTSAAEALRREPRETLRGFRRFEFTGEEYRQRSRLGPPSERIDPASSWGHWRGIAAKIQSANILLGIVTQMLSASSFPDDRPSVNRDADQLWQSR